MSLRPKWYRYHRSDENAILVTNPVQRRILFEVNIGKIAACAPILRPFTRYIEARITGQDPHHILREFPTPSFHSSYTRASCARSPVQRNQSVVVGTRTLNARKTDGEKQ
ncbi:MAG: hypothetical protein LQ349_008001 [Xanthoria aureola]|nr:MAG: hypothetical protein LQ349_008001 [Xanthoria aureola]